jgi:glycosyltransferase involved in cell wall biosynthesis
VRICFISNCRKLGGAERVLLETIDVLAENGAECLVLLPGEGKFSEELARRGISYRVVYSTAMTMTGEPPVWERCKAAIRFVIATLAVMRQMAKWKCDAVYSNTVTVGHGAIAAKLLAKPHIWHLHEFGREDHGFEFYFGERFSCRTVGALSLTCIAVSKALATKYQQFIAPSKLVVVYPSMHLELERESQPVDATPTVALQNGQFRCVIVGGVFAGKRQEDAVAAFALLQKENLHAELTMVGASEFSEYRGELDRVICEHKLQNKVIFAGEVRDAHAVIHASDVLLMCSRSEAFGRVTIEAMLAGKPVIGADAGATPELVQDGFNGLVYKVADPCDLAAKVLYLYQHPEIARCLGENGKRWAQAQFTKNRYAQQLTDILNTFKAPASHHVS